MRLGVGVTRYNCHVSTNSFKNDVDKVVKNAQSVTDLRADRAANYKSVYICFLHEIQESFRNFFVVVKMIAYYVVQDSTHEFVGREEEGAPMEETLCAEFVQKRRNDKRYVGKIKVISTAGCFAHFRGEC